LVKEVAEINKITDKIIKQTALNSIEQKMIALKDSVISKFQNHEIDTKYNSFHQGFKQKTLQFLDQYTDNYGKLSIEQKKEQIDFYIACLENISDFYDILSDV
ncbi:hypothetical protein RZS08_27480, partial [Arthrospira platensis SPKY1]|nr:hypothetical protein [Arthrospira platensis SPKY1]